MRGLKPFAGNPHGHFVCTRSPWVHILDQFGFLSPYRLEKFKMV